jgi:hypothetical protein
MVKSYRRNSPKKIPWRDNSSSMMTLYSILSAMVGAVLAIAITDKEINDYWIWPISLLSFSLICLITAIEKFSDALDENDVDKYLTWLMFYNVGVISMFFGIASYIYIHYHLCFIKISGNLLYINNVLHCIPYFAAIIVSSKWISDFFELLFGNRKGYEDYRKELLGDIKPKVDPDLFMKIHRFLRKHLNG